MTTNNPQVSKIFSHPLVNRFFDLMPILLALLAALLVASLLLIGMEANPFEAYAAMLQGAVGTENAFAETIVKAIPIMLVGIGISVAFRGGVINIGGEGQMIAGALASVTVILLAQGDLIIGDLVIGDLVIIEVNPFLFRDLFGGLVIPLALLAGFVAGGLYGGLAGFLKAQFGVNEILSTIMLNQVAVQMMNFLLNGPLLDPTTAGLNNIPKTARIADFAELPRLSLTIEGGVEIFTRTRLHTGLLVAILLAIVIYILLWRTTVGYRIRAVGQNERAARYAGINVKRQMTLSMFLAGGAAGLAGAVQVMGLQYRLQTDGSPGGFTASAGFNGIVAALFGGLNPIGTLFSSVFFGGLLVGAQKMQRELGVPASLIITVNGLIVVFIVSSQIFIRRRSQRRVNLASATDSPVETGDPPDPPIKDTSVEKGVNA